MLFPGEPQKSEKALLQFAKRKLLDEIALDNNVTEFTLISENAVL